MWIGKLVVVTAVAVLASGGGALAAATNEGVQNPRAAHPARGPVRDSMPVPYGVEIQAVFDRAGNPDLVANFSPDGGLSAPAWSICRPPAVKRCVATNRKIELRPGPTPVGTVFQASAAYQGREYTARSARWLGVVRATSPPRLRGRARYGATVTARGASWSGGWGSEFDYLRVEACRTRDANPRHCVTLSAPGEGFGFDNRPPTIGAWYTGLYLFAIDERFARDTAFAEPGYGSPAAVPPVQIGPTVARSAAVGPVIGPAPPRISFLRDAQLNSGRIFVARATCSTRCHVFLEVFDNRSGSDARVTLTGSHLVGVPRRELHHGRLNIYLHVDTGPQLTATTRLN